MQIDHHLSEVYIELFIPYSDSTYLQWKIIFPGSIGYFFLHKPLYGKKSLLLSTQIILLPSFFLFAIQNIGVYMIKNSFKSVGET